MGGLIGSHIDMAKLGENWREMLHRHGDITFHMSELEGSLEEFEGWTKDQRKALLGDVFRCLNGLFLLAFGASVIVEQYRALPGMAQDAFVDPWMLCFQMCVSEAARTMMVRVDDHSSTEKLALVYDQQKDFRGRASSCFQYLKEASSFGSRLGTCTPASKKDIIQLQAADLVAYEIRKLIENSIYAPAVGMRWPMRRLQEMPLMCTSRKGSIRKGVQERGQPGRG